MNSHFKLTSTAAISFIALISLTSCSELVEKIHRDLDQQHQSPGPEMMAMASASANDPKRPMGFKTKKFDKRPLQDPLTYTLEGDRSWEEQELMTGPIDIKRRQRSSDFEDRDQSGSLWQSYDDASSFFTSTNDRKAGQIIVIDVMEGLRQTITSELKRAYPAPGLFQEQTNGDGASSSGKGSALDQALADLKKPEAAGGDNANDTDAKKARDPASAAAAGNDQVEIVYDKISTRIDKTYLNDHVLLKGRKEVVFRQKKRLIEIHALVKKNTLDPKDHVKSDDIVESRVMLVGPTPKGRSWW